MHFLVDVGLGNVFFLLLLGFLTQSRGLSLSEGLFPSLSLLLLPLCLFGSLLLSFLLHLLNSADLLLDLLSLPLLVPPRE